MSDHSNKDRTNKPSFWQLVISILGAAFGVQSSKAQERDFKQRSPKAYIVGGIIFGVLFVLTIVVVVNIVLSNVQH